MSSVFVVVEYIPYTEGCNALAAFTDREAADEYLEKCRGDEVLSTTLDAPFETFKNFEVIFNQLTGLVSVSVVDSLGMPYQIYRNGDDKEIKVSIAAENEKDAVCLARDVAITEFDMRRVRHNLGSA